jgi:flagellar hook-associated protein 1 FlgK
MSLLGLFDIGKSAIFASQQALNVVSNNIANVNTPGYSRHEAILEINTPTQVGGDFIGRGVSATGIRRHYDSFLHLQTIGQNSNLGRSYSIDQAMSHVNQIFNDAVNLGLSDPLKEYFNAWQAVSTEPEGQPERIALLQKAKNLVQRAGQMEKDLIGTIENINEDIVNSVNDINTILTNIATLNEKITQLEAGLSTKNASYFRDERDRLLNGLAEQMNYNWYENSNGSVTVMAGGKSLLSADKVYQLTTQLNTDGNRDVYYQGQNITSVFQKGKLGGLYAARSDIETNSLLSLRRLTASLIKETNSLHSTGYGLDNTTNNNFFSPLQIYTRDYSTAGYVSSASVSDVSALTLDEYDVRFTSTSNYEVYNRQSGSMVTSGSYTAGATINFDGIDVVIDGAPSAGESFLVSPLTNIVSNFSVNITDTQKIAAASASANLPGDNSMALQIAQLAQASISDLSGTTFSGYYNGIVSNVGITSKAAEDSLTYDDNLSFELQNKREAVSGVSLDEEAANLIKFQRSFEAGARLIKITDELMQVVINL